MDKRRIQLRWFEAGIALAVIAAFAVIGPLRATFAPISWVMLLCTLILFLTPGALLVRWFWRDYFSAPRSRRPLSSRASGSSPSWRCPCSLCRYPGRLPVGLRHDRRRVLARRRSLGVSSRPTGRRSDRLRALRPRGSALDAVRRPRCCALVHRQEHVPELLGDVWIYLSWVREYLGGDRLASVEPFFGSRVDLSRARINGWLLEQAAVSKVSGVDPVELAFSYLNPALVVVAFLVFYALARVLFESEKAALFSGLPVRPVLLCAPQPVAHSLGRGVRPASARGQTGRQVPLLASGPRPPTRLCKAGRRGTTSFLVSVLCRCGRASHRPGDHRDLHGRVRRLYLAANPRSRAAWTRISAMGLTGVAIISRSGGPRLVVYR